jgi:hypothetical protein
MIGAMIKLEDGKHQRRQTTWFFPVVMVAIWLLLTVAVGTTKQGVFN